MIAQVPLDVFRKDLTDRCALMIEKSQGPPRERMFIRRHLLVRLVNLAKQERDESSALLYVLSYAFMLRVPSEALPMRMATVEDAVCGPSGETQSAIYAEAGKLHLALHRRKNLQHGSRMVRDCWCQSCSITCPTHAFERSTRCFSQGQPLFPHLTAENVRSELRRRLGLLNVDFPWKYCSHDFRRGHCLDMVLSGRPLHEILSAGQWHSNAFRKYVDRRELEEAAVLDTQLHTDLNIGAVMEEHLGASDDEH